jgi:general transcription factor 3C polypeptide 3 (transcription factor C subunit 4)
MYRFARGDVENAEKMCLEIIRQDPTVPEPFQTLATIFEEAEEIEKSLQFALIAAHLGTTYRINFFDIGFKRLVPDLDLLSTGSSNFKNHKQ